MSDVEEGTPESSPSARGSRSQRSSRLRMVTNFDDNGSPSRRRHWSSRSDLRPLDDFDSESADEDGSHAPSRHSDDSDDAPTAPFSSPDLEQQLQNLAVNADDAAPRPAAAIASNPRNDSRRAEQPKSIEDFVMRPVPQGQKIEAKIIRHKAGMEKLYPQYELCLEEADGSLVFLLAARKRKRSKSSSYIITTTRLKGKSNDEVIGRVKSNFLGTAFTIYDSGLVRSAADIAMGCREELGAVLYEPNILGFKGPRKMTVVLPAMTMTQQRIAVIPKQESETILERYKCGDRQILALHNKTPQWSEESQSFVLNFSNRVSLASVKNFQIVHDNDPDYIVMQFGRVSDDTFTMDCQYPMSCVQAFGIALTSFDAKLACE